MTSTTDTAAVPQALVDVEQLVDERTREILDRRRRAGIVRRRGWLIRRALLAADLAGLVAAFLLAGVLAPAKGQGDLASLPELAAFTLSLPLWVVFAKLQGLYDHDEERTDHTTPDDVVGVFQLVTLGTWVLFAGSWLTGIAHPDVARLVVFWGLAVVAVTFCRAGARFVCRRHVSYIQNTLIVGAGDVGQLVARKLLAHPEYGINLVGFVDAEPKEQRPDLAHLTVVGKPADLPELVQLLDVERVIFAFSRDPHEELVELMRDLTNLDVQIDIVPRFFDVLGAHADFHTVEGLSLLGLAPLRLSRSSRLLKRGMDVTGSVVGLVLFAPLFALVSVLIKLDSRGPIFFRQVRMGARERTFEILKFRTMAADAEARKAGVAKLNMHADSGGDPRMFKVPDDPRVTRVGKFLRRWSLDELPQLINVLKGEMSLVGPRPLILDEHRYVEDWAKKRLNLKPGVTGLWQALGRSEIPFEEMVHLDYRYVTGWSLLQDVKIVLRTVPALIRERTAY